MIVEATGRLLTAWNVSIIKVTVSKRLKGKRTEGTVYIYKRHMSTTDLITSRKPGW